jgi:mRNA-degrading endonuclease RelE of RelBE toxin-antitoxin system
MIHIEILCIQK